MTEEQSKKGFFSRFKKSENTAEQSSESTAAEKSQIGAAEPTEVSDAGAEKKRFLSRMKSGLSKTRQAMSSGFGTLLLGRREIDDELFEDLEMQLVVSDVGVDATRQVIGNLEQRVERQEMADGQALVSALQQELTNILEPCQTPLDVDSVKEGPFVLLVVGVNGVGKTTTIGKMAKFYQQQGKSVMLAAGDTFRAAAVEQLQVWGERNDVPVIAQHTGADSASVIFDAVQAAKARNTDIIIADTAGRLHNKSNLMEELSKVVRVMQKLDVTAPHEVLLVLDAATGQNALSQAEHFRKAVGVTGIALTKLDGTAKGGVIFAIAKQLGLPIRFIGVGEQIDDLRPFRSEDFVEALFEDLEI
ncbi:signal recognition particle-docking protein FtsY [Litoribacillus peritrichatus]|uniref:Signal recognition particle receptor FtsY n=1 Tax=Litoribacillus peritrichatus TaxID=718191 RepID=A0ABP7MNA3_9GAMM